MKYNCIGHLLQHKNTPKRHILPLAMCSGCSKHDLFMLDLDEQSHLPRPPPCWVNKAEDSNRSVIIDVIVITMTLLSRNNIFT